MNSVPSRTGEDVRKSNNHNTERHEPSTTCIQPSAVLNHAEPNLLLVPIWFSDNTSEERPRKPLPINALFQTRRLCVKHTIPVMEGVLCWTWVNHGEPARSDECLVRSGGTWTQIDHNRFNDNNRPTRKRNSSNHNLIGSMITTDRPTKKKLERTKHTLCPCRSPIPMVNTAFWQILSDVRLTLQASGGTQVTMIHWSNLVVNQWLINEWLITVNQWLISMKLIMASDAKLMMAMILHNRHCIVTTNYHILNRHAHRRCPSQQRTFIVMILVWVVTPLALHNG